MRGPGKCWASGVADNKDHKVITAQKYFNLDDNQGTTGDERDSSGMQVTV